MANSSSMLVNRASSGWLTDRTLLVGASLLDHELRGVGGPVALQLGGR